MSMETLETLESIAAGAAALVMSTGQFDTPWVVLIGVAALVVLVRGVSSAEQEDPDEFSRYL